MLLPELKEPGKSMLTQVTMLLPELKEPGKSMLTQVTMLLLRRCDNA